MAAEERREVILECARREFAAHGLHGASTRAIASCAGISQPYVFQHFSTKKELFLAVLDASFERTLEALRGAAELPREQVFPAIGRVYIAQLESDPEGLTLLTHFLAACGDPDVRARMQQRYGELYQYVERVSGANDEAVRTLFAYGMLATTAAALRLSELQGGPEDWATRLLGFLDGLYEA